MTNPDTEPKKRRGRAKRQVAQRPSDWAPNANHKSFSSDNGIDMAREAAKFCDFHDAKGNLYADWDAAFRTWLRNAVEFSKRSEPNQQPAEDPNMKKLRELAQATVKAERARRTAAWDGSQKA